MIQIRAILESETPYKSPIGLLVIVRTDVITEQMIAIKS